MNIFFTKMQGIGNDFIAIDNFNGRINFTKKLISYLCDRHKGIGADGLILVESSTVGADCFMNYYNSDGSEAEMCGNGIRCTALFLKNDYLKDKNIFEIETRSGVKKITYKDDGTFSVNMGKPIFIHEDFPKKSIILQGLDLNFVSVGNPHAVAFVNNLNDFELEKVGSLMEIDSSFPNKINFELVEKINDKEFKVLVWERGCGKTLACGTGACAVFALIDKNINENKDSEKEIKIKLPGGDLFISKNIEGEIIMRGEAQSVFGGEVCI